MSGLQSRFAAAFAAVAELLGHQLAVEQRQVGKVRQFRAVCSCGYATEWGKSLQRHTLAGVGHIQRISKTLEPEQREKLGVSLRDIAGARGDDLPPRAA